MNDRNLRNVSASVKQRLLNLARRDNEELQQYITRYALERLLYRLARSGHGHDFVLKGATLFSVWGQFPRRATKDVDLLGRGDPGLQRLAEMFRDICRIEVEDDGLSFHPETVTAERIRKDEEYLGVRVRMNSTLGGARCLLQIDIGFGDAVLSEEAELPGLLDLPRARMRVYRPESSIAEKLQAMMTLGATNSRLKDFYDVWLLASRLTFDEAILCDAIERTLARRKTPLDSGVPYALGSGFFEDEMKQTQFKAFVRKAGPRDLILDFNEVGERLRTFLLPPLDAIRIRAVGQRRWFPGGPWR